MVLNDNPARGRTASKVSRIFTQVLAGYSPNQLKLRIV
jgi:hypothetical protein